MKFHKLLQVLHSRVRPRRRLPRRSLSFTVVFHPVQNVAEDSKLGPTKAHFQLICQAVEFYLGPPSNPSQQVTPQASAHPFPSSTPVPSRSVPLPPRDPSRLFVQCPGIPIEWDADTFYTTYPFQLHSPNAKNCAPYDLMIVSGIPRARSPQCLGGTVTIEGIQPCAKCSRLTLDVNIIRGRAARSFEHIRDHNDLSSDQLRAKVTVVKDKVNTLRLKKLDLEVSLQRAQARLSEWIELFHFIGQNSGSIPALHRLLGNAEKEGWSATKILEYCRLAHAGQYTARNYTQAEIDLAMLIYELGGAGAIYALNHSIFALPSRNTIQPYRRQLNLLPSVSGLRFTDIFRNITTLFGPRTHHEGEAELLPPVKCGHTVSVDEVAADRNIDLMHETDEMGGFCLEHVSKLETVKIGKDLRSVEAAVAAVKEGTVHVAQEICVAAISHLYGTDYGAKPVYMGPTCKKGSWQEQVRLIEVILEAWKRSPDGEAKHGPIMSVASDGDHKRRLALFVLCMRYDIAPGNPLWPFVRNLPGLNLRVGKDNLTNDGDPKHIFKRNRALVSSSEGITIKNVCINRDLLLGWLERLPNQDWSETSIHNLLHPSDGQNVSDAIKLMMSIIEIAKLDTEDFDPGEMAEFEALCLLGEAYNALQPFINVELTLSEQIESLVTASHLFCALYIQNGTSFMSNQLYADMQSMFKNAVLMVPKTRLVNGQLKVYICLLGDDVLEALFGRSRMLGGHSPNCSIGVLRDRFNSAMNLDNIYERHPELERQPRRLNILRKRHVDHFRPVHFKRELRADSCDLEKCWAAAVQAAERILLKHGLQMAVTFAERFKRKDTDLSRPLGGKYPAISGGVDRSMTSVSDAPAEDLIDPETRNFAQLVAGVDIDAMIVSENNYDSSTGTPHSLFAEIDATGRLAHKKSILRTLFDMTVDGHASHDRLQRVRGYTIGGKSWARDVKQDHNISTKTHFQLGNLFTTLLAYNNTHLGLAVARCTLIKHTPPGSKPISMSAVARTELHLPSSIKGKKLDSQCPSAYPFMISTSKKFFPTRPCTNVPLACEMLGCKDIHWKYNFQQHLEERHPDWQQLISATFLLEIQISREELLALKIPPQTAVAWPPPAPTPKSPPVLTLQAPSSSTPTGSKRSASSPTQRVADKENYAPDNSPSAKRRRMN
ncbi:hypothetical protein R3P38DRAFT_3212810 [Favolaschia claudopus]|uniref:Uncharacterized protein n=1 Tax=Favolaschia claudopus TaxID=2862362 RepID=A0AAW0AEC9_9AGAR